MENSLQKVNERLDKLKASYAKFFDIKLLYKGVQQQKLTEYQKIEKSILKQRDKFEQQFVETKQESEFKEAYAIQHLLKMSQFFSKYANCETVLYYMYQDDGLYDMNLIQSLATITQQLNLLKEHYTLISESKEHYAIDQSFQIKELEEFLDVYTYQLRRVALGSGFFSIEFDLHRSIESIELNGFELQLKYLVGMMIEKAVNRLIKQEKKSAGYKKSITFRIENNKNEILFICQDNSTRQIIEDDEYAFMKEVAKNLEGEFINEESENSRTITLKVLKRKKGKRSLFKRLFK